MTLNPGKYGAIVIFLTGLVLVSCGPIAEPINPESGVVQLSAEDVQRITPIRGVWEVYPGESFTPADFAEPRIPQYSRVPPPYGRHYRADGTRHVTGPITYRLVLENVPASPLLAIRFSPAYGACTSWVNGGVQTGRIIPIRPDEAGTVELVVQIYKGCYPFGGMAHYPPVIGPLDDLTGHAMARLLRDGVLIGALIFLGLYHVLLTLGPTRTGPTLVLAGIAFFLAVYLFVLGRASAFTVAFSVPTALHTRIIGLAVYPLPALYLRFLRQLYPLEARGRTGVIVERLLWAWLIASLVVPLQWWTDLLYAGIAMMVGVMILVGTILTRALRSRRDGIALVVTGLAVVVTAMILDLAGTVELIPLHDAVTGYGFVLFAGFNSLAVFLRIVDFRISLTNLKEQAQHDGLTGLYNRRTLDARVLEEHLRHGRAQRPLALIMLDVDRFKPYNDRNGHQAGDRVLKAVATVLDNHARRSGDIAARYGGEEFALLLPHTDIHDAYQIAESIRRSVAAHRMPHPDSAFGVVTVSLGVTVLDPAEGGRFSADPESLYRAADRALYDAKETGRNRVRTAYVDEAERVD